VRASKEGKIKAWKQNKKHDHLYNYNNYSTVTSWLPLRSERHKIYTFIMNTISILRLEGSWIV
jgi:hypothetical protein